MQQMMPHSGQNKNCAEGKHGYTSTADIWLEIVNWIVQCISFTVFRSCVILCSHHVIRVRWLRQCRPLPRCIDDALTEVGEAVELSLQVLTLTPHDVTNPLGACRWRYFFTQTFQSLGIGQTWKDGNIVIGKCHYDLSQCQCHWQVSLWFVTMSVSLAIKCHYYLSQCQCHWQVSLWFVTMSVSLASVTIICHNVSVIGKCHYYLSQCHHG